MLVLAAVALTASAPPALAAHALGTRTLHPGVHGADVRVAQVLLRRVTADRIAIDGVYGPQTTRAARDYETARHLGINGRLTRGEQRLLRQDGDAVAAQRREAAAQAAAQAAPLAAAVPAGGAAPAAPPAPTATATLNPDGTATAPPDAPPAVAAIIAAGNEIATKPYKYGGGHPTWVDTGYDCSGSVSYALHGAGLLDSSMPSGGFEDWGDPGPGTWVTIYARADHMYMTVAGLRFDTSGAHPSRWQSTTRTADGYAVRHPPGL